jgi:3-oxoadipate enol-lactonase
MPQIGVGGRKVYYEVHGDHPGVPLLLLMGMAGSCRGWLPLQVPAFCAKRRTVIFDHRGAGGSDDPGGPFSTPQFADDTVNLLDALEIECADVLGVFMGGMVAQEIALRHPDRVNRLLLTGTFARPDAKRRLLLEHWRDLAKGSDALEVLIRERLLWTLMDETLEQTDLIQSMVDYFKREGLPITADVFVRQCEACLRHDTSDRLAGIPHPTLIVCGERDRLTPLSMHRQLAEAIPNSHLVAINYGAHMVMVESAEHFNRVVLQFVSDDR